MVIYRLNRIPDKLHVALLDLLGIAAGAAHRGARRPALPARRAAHRAGRHPGGETEVGTPRTPGEEPIVFQTLDDFTIPAARPTPTPSSAAAPPRTSASPPAWREPKGPDQLPFGTPPTVGDALYLGFDVAARAPAAAASTSTARRRAAPASTPRTRRCAWEVSSGEAPGGWAEAHGARGHDRRLQLRQRRRRAPAARRRTTRRRSRGTRAYWVRCRLDDTTRAGRARRHASPTRPRSTRSPPRRSARWSPPPTASRDRGRADRRERRHAGADLPAAQRARARAEGDEALEVLEPESTDWRPWDLRESFAESGPADRHYVLDLASGEVELGPAIRTGDGALAAVRDGARRRARGCASPATATAAAAAATSPRARSPC